MLLPFSDSTHVSFTVSAMPAKQSCMTSKQQWNVKHTHTLLCYLATHPRTHNHSN